MRAVLAPATVVALVILVGSGCRSGAGSSGWNWGWGRKNAAVGPGAAGSMSGPQLPSAGASPEGYAPNSYDAGVGPYDQSGANSQQAAPYGAQTGYNNAYPAGGAGGYGTPPGAGGVAYGAPAGAPLPQAGPYNENYNQPQAGAYGAAPNPQGYAPQGAPATAYQPPAANPSGAALAQPSAAPYANQYAAPAGNNGTTQVIYGNDPSGAASYQTADNRNAGGYGTSSAQAEQAAADRYATGAGDQAATGGAASSDAYQPGNTGYNPGQTGYSPPGVPPYQSTGQTNVDNAPRRNPYYRPGSTSDYLPSSNSQSSGATDRYGVPVSGAPGGY